MIGIEVRIQGDKELDEKLGRFRGKKVGQRICKEIANNLVEDMKTLVPYWHGNLQKSIKAIPHENGYSVDMFFYGRFVEGGTRPHVVSANNYLFRAWALSHNIPWAALMASVRIRGTQPHPFIQPALNNAYSNLESVSVSVLNKTLKESGFSQR